MTDFKFFEPGQLIQIDKDVTVPADTQGCQRLSRAVGVLDWYYRQNRVDVTIPAGTVLQIGAYRNNRVAGAQCTVSLLIVDSPERRFLPKSRHGTGFRTVIHPKVRDFNALGFSGEFVG